ncbi:MAG: PilN domain-containing protein [Deltaproteobacteria bacterium]|nr:PilN domain-containing protein [Deltaproteobacteria bacterium]
MIRINLLPVKAARKREFGKQQLILLGVAVAVALVANFLWWQSVDNELSRVQRQIDATRSDIAQLEKTIGEVKSITQEKKALEDKLKILDDLKQGRTGPVKVLDELSSIIPQKVVLEDFTEQGGNVSMRGTAVTYDDLSTFSKKLKTSKHFTDVVIKKASQRNDGVVTWEITCRANYQA